MAEVFSCSIWLPQTSKLIDLPEFPDLRVFYQNHVQKFLSDLSIVTLSINDMGITLTNYDRRKNEFKLLVFGGHKYWVQGLSTDQGNLFNFRIVRVPESWHGPIQVISWAAGEYGSVKWCKTTVNAPSWMRSKENGWLSYHKVFVC